jgi:hypothetical protein
MIALKNNRVTHLSGNIPIFFIYSDDQICGSVIIDKNLLFDGVSIGKFLLCVNQTFSIIGDNFQVGIYCKIQTEVLKILAF